MTHSGSNVREFYSTLPGPVRVGIEATGTMQWFLSLMEELGIDCQVGHPAKIRAAEPRKQKHDRRDADLILKLLVENRFPSIWRPSKECGSNWSTPAVTDKQVYIGAVGVLNYIADHHGGFFAVEPATGKVLWRYPMAAISGSATYGVASSPTVDHGLVFFGGLDGAFYAFGTDN